jgi:hypothetical protein
MDVDLRLREALRERADGARVIEVDVRNGNRAQVAGINPRRADAVQQMLDNRGRARLDQRGPIAGQQIRADRLINAVVVRVDEYEIGGQALDAGAQRTGLSGPRPR